MENPLIPQAEPHDFQEVEEGLHFTSEGDPIVENPSNIYKDSENSEDSDDEYGEISEMAREEMSKLERIFQKKGLKFRMIDRIGEGMF